MYVVVMGCGRVGSGLATAIVAAGHEVAIIDQDPAAFVRLPPSFTGRTVVGRGFDRNVLIDAGIERAEAFAAVSSGDNSNIIAARTAREHFGVERVVARIYDAKRAAVYERMGIPTIATVPWTTDLLLHELLPEAPGVHWTEPTGSVTLTAAHLDPGWIGRKVTALESAAGARVAFVIRLGRGVIPEPGSVLQADDEVYLAALVDDVTRAITIAAAPPVDKD